MSKKSILSKPICAAFDGKRSISSAVAVYLLIAFPAAALGQAVGITDLGMFAGGNRSTAYGVSSNGNVVVGEFADPASGSFRAFRWDQAIGMISLGSLNGGLSSLAWSVNRDGSTIVGSADDGAIAFAGATRAFRWTQASGMISLGTLNGGNRSQAFGVSGDGNTVVGSADDGADRNRPLRAFRWTQASGMTSLGVLNGGLRSEAVAISADGNVVVGGAWDGAVQNTPRAFRWTQSTGMVSLGTLNGGFQSTAQAVNSDGSVVVGDANDGTAGGLVRAFRWTQASGMVSLGVLNGSVVSSALGVSGDGRVVVGYADDGVRGVSHAFRWTQATGMQSVEDWLRANGVIVPADITRVATSVSSDGSVVVGTLKNPVTQLNAGSFIARVSPIGNGMVTLQDLQSSLSGNTIAGTQAANLGGMVINGAHSRPLSHRGGAGKSCVWTAGDIGRDNHAERDGSFGLIEIGGCHRLTQHLQGSLSVGRTSSRQNLVFNGKSVVSTTYGIAELLGRIPGTTLWPSAALMYQAGEADARRGYLNAGVQDISIGRPGVNTTALRLRTDWDGALTMGNTSLTPYADITHARTRINAYIESGGGFPALFDARSEKSTEAHVGVDATYAVSSSTKLLGRIDAAHRFENNAAATSGTVLGLFSFNLPGQKIKRDWIRAGVGFDTKLGAGVASAFLNATTQGAAPNHWLNVSYQVAF